MKFLIVYSHPYEKSFNHAILETLDQELQKLGRETRVRDLYAMNFNPVLSAADMQGFARGEYPEDLAREHEHVRWADMLVFICPIWWGGLTAQLRGYMDRVFSNGFAYRETEGGLEKLLTDKKAFTINTIGAPAYVYEKAGHFRCMDQILDQIAFDFSGIQSAGHKYFGSVSGCSDDERRQMLEEVRGLARGWAAA